MPRTGCSEQALSLLVIATLSLTACATVASDPRVASVCPPIAAYDRTFQARLVEETQRLPPGAALEQAMLDYARFRDQARACAMRPTAP
jgi:hypothetical protein